MKKYFVLIIELTFSFLSITWLKELPNTFLLYHKIIVPLYFSGEIKYLADIGNSALNMIKKIITLTTI